MLIFRGRDTRRSVSSPCSALMKTYWIHFMTCERRSMCVGEHSTTYERLVDLIVSRALGGVERAMGIEPKRAAFQSL
jgi:hypothetical protein